MKGDVHNLRRRFELRGAWVAVPAALSMLLAVGVTTPHAVELAKLRESAERADSAARECARLGESVFAFQGAEGVQRARAAIELGRHVIPTDCSTVEIHSALRLAAMESGWHLALLNVGEPTAFVESAGKDTLARRNVELSGSAAYSGLSSLVRALAAHGYPARVLSLSLTRAQSSADGFETHAILTLFHNVSPATSGSAISAAGPEDD